MSESEIDPEDQEIIEGTDPDDPDEEDDPYSNEEGARPPEEPGSGLRPGTSALTHP